MKNVLQIENLSISFRTDEGTFNMVKNLSYSVKEGEIVGIVGESGCGKSTLGRLMLNLLEPTSGEMLLDGQNIYKLRTSQMKKMRTRAQMIFQDPYSSLNPRMSVSEIIAEPIIANDLIKNRQDIQKRVEELMDTVGLAQRCINA